MLTALRSSLLILGCFFVACSGGGTTNNRNPDASIDAEMACDCPTFQFGDMFTVCGQQEPFRLIVNQQGEAMYFASEAVFESWRPSNEAMSSISQDCFDRMRVPKMYPIGVNYRPGSFVVKREWIPSQLYVILPHNTLAPISAELATMLYGNPAYADGANSDPVVIIEPHWSNFVRVAPEITQVRVHPGMLFVVTDGQDIYYADADGLIRGMTPEGFTANHFQRRFVRRVPVSAIAGMSFGALITSRVPAIDDPTQGN